MQTAPPPDWSPTSWQQKEARQQADYPDEAALQTALRELRSLPPLVTSWEIDALKGQLAEAAYGKRFLLQGGDCAEDFSECNARVIANRLRILLQMSLVLVYGLKTRVVRVGRFAGQYAKPRSKGTETRDGVTLPTYRGDIVNGLPFTPEARTPDPGRLLQAYSRSALTLNYVRALAAGGFADLHHPEFWELDFVKHSPLHSEYRGFVDAMTEAVGFIETLSESHLSELEQVQFFTSHEALHLHFEEALTRDVWYGDETYNLSAHLPWIGMRTAHLDGAHVEYMRGIANPIGIKLGPAMTASWLLDLLPTCSTPTTSRAGSPSSPASAPTRSATACLRSSRRCGPPGGRYSGAPTRCTATPRRRLRATRRAGSKTFLPNWSRPSTSTPRWAAASAASTSS